MAEQQNTEYKQNWQEDCLKWVCGFANTTGGTFYIGVDDSGKIRGINNYKE